MSLTKKREHYKPFLYPWAFEAYHTAQKMHWLPDEVPLQEDIDDWNTKLTEQRRTCSLSCSASSLRRMPTSRQATMSATFRPSLTRNCG
jgi:ribonucleotide reductase beta subunit family protein with ferritin-like domain